MKKIFLVILLSLILIPNAAYAEIVINTYSDSQYYGPTSIFSEGPVYFTVSDGSYCCDKTDVVIKSQNENITVAAYDNGIIPDKEPNDGIFFGVFHIGEGLADSAINYIRSETDEALEIHVSFSRISSGNRIIYTEFSKPVAVELSAEFRDNAVTLNWNPSSDISGIKNYIVYRHTEKFSESDISRISSFMTENTSYIDRSIEDGKIYYYSVIPVDNLNTKGQFSNIVEISTPDITAPKSITDLHYTQYRGEVTLKWNRPYDNVGIAKYLVYRDTLSIESPETQIPYAETDNIIYIDKNTNDGERFYYAVFAVDTLNNIARPSNNVLVEIDKTPPEKITDLEAHQRKNGEIFLNWSGSDMYRIYYSIYPITSVNGLSNVIINESTFSDFPEKPMYYTVSAIDVYGNEAENSNIVFGDPDDISPNPPENLNAIAYSNGTVFLSWDPSGSQDVMYYDVYRTRENEYVHITRTDEKRVFDRNIIPGTYHYIVKAVDGAGNEGESSVQVNVIDTEINLIILHPQNDISVSQAQILVLGSVDTDAEIEVENNGIVFDAMISENGNFAGYANLSDGENELKVKATDPAGNSKEQKLKITNRYVSASTDARKKIQEYIGKNITFDNTLFDELVESDPSLSGSDMFTTYVFTRTTEIVGFVILIILVVVVIVFHKKTKKEIVKIVGTKLKYEYDEKSRLKNAATKYISAIPSEIIRGVKNLRIKRVEKEATVLFADIRGFTNLASKLGHNKTADMLDIFFKEMADIIIKHGGSVAEYVGDRIYATFNLNKECNNHSHSAVKSSEEMHGVVKELNKKIFGVDNKMQIGVGIKTGKLVAGTIGHPEALKYAAVGDVVNIASKLSDSANAGETIIDEDTYKEIKDKVNVIRNSITLKGGKVINAFKILSLKE
ncbi:MAG: hypothetical protein ISS36_02180 [Candidatus Aenigmarchaeota archaeon]|nr:hypothetical protein [Candidatus Aenigmarchaeota archaeon]